MGTDRVEQLGVERVQLLIAGRLSWDIKGLSACGCAAEKPRS